MLLLSVSHFHPRPELAADSHSERNASMPVCGPRIAQFIIMIRKLKTGEFRLYSRKKDKNGRRGNMGTFSTREAAAKHEREAQFFKRAG